MPVGLPRSAGVAHRKVSILRSSISSGLTRGHEVWGVFWLGVSFVFFVLGILVGIVAFKETAAQQAASTFLDSPFEKHD